MRHDLCWLTVLQFDNTKPSMFNRWDYVGTPYASDYAPGYGPGYGGYDNGTPPRGRSREKR